MQVWAFPADAVHLSSHPREFGLLALLGLLTSFTSTLMFTAMGSFFNRISDPDMVHTLPEHVAAHVSLRASSLCKHTMVQPC